jgi:HKD family nuclease
MDSTFLATSTELIEAFQSALQDADSFDIAVAWAASFAHLSMLCDYAQAGKSLRAIIGRDRYATHPDAVRRLLAAAPGKIRWGRTPSQGIFHPKVFVFHHRERITALVGSANLTRGGFDRNTEATVRLAGTAGELGSLVQFFEREWSQGTLIDEGNLARYEEEWRAQLRPPSEVSATRTAENTSPAAPVEEDRVLTWSWDEY